MRKLATHQMREGRACFGELVQIDGSEHGTIAGSVLTMERALHNVLLATGRSLREIWPMSSLNAARAIGVSAAKGSLEVGRDADLALLESDFRVSLAIVAGELVYQADPQRT